VLGIGGFDLERFLSFIMLYLDLLLLWTEYHLSDDYVPLKLSYTLKKNKESHQDNHITYWNLSTLFKNTGMIHCSCNFNCGRCDPHGAASSTERSILFRCTEQHDFFNLNEMTHYAKCISIGTWYWAYCFY
jgi:hypothetical protein